MDESNWWLYLMGAVVAYYVIPWGAVFKWLAVGVCVGMAFTFFTDDGHATQYRLIGGIFFAAMAVMVARSEYRESDPAPSGKGKGKQRPQSVRTPCFHCNGTGQKACYCPTTRGKRDIMGPACFECYDTKYKRCYMCHGTGWR